MPKRKASKASRTIRKNHRKKHLGYGVIAGTLFAVAIILYLGFNGMKINSASSFEDCAALGSEIMESYPRQCMVNGKTFFESTMDSSPINILQIDKSENGKYIHVERGNYIINALAEWNSIFGAMEIEPGVNFEDKTILVVVMGQKPTGGYSVGLKQLEVGDETIQFMVEEVIPGENCIVTQAITNPYQIIAIDKTEKEIKFVGNTVINECVE